MDGGSRGDLVGLPALGIAGALLLPPPASAPAQDAGECVLVCTPEVTAAPSLTIENLFGELTFEPIWTPVADATTNPFTGRTAEELGEQEIGASLDYLATGLPEAGDVIGGERFLEDPNPSSLTLSAITPVAPLRS